MHQTKDTKFLIIFEDMKRSLLAADILFHRIGNALKTFEPLIDASIDVGDRAAIPLIDAIAFIDFAHRFGTLVAAIPLIKKSSEQVKKLLKLLKSVDVIRNHLQHLRGDLSAKKEIQYAILGLLQWSNGQTNYILAFTQPVQYEIKGMAYDVLGKNWESTLEYDFADQRLHLEAILIEMKSTFDFIVTIVTFSDPQVAKLSWGTTQTLGVKNNCTPSGISN